MRRKIKELFHGQPVVEGAGVHLRRLFASAEVPKFDPFLMLDDFRSDTPDHFVKGFPWHPHRGIETITYIISGDVEHGDSLGNKGIISSGDVQWMTAGSGVVHQEMPLGDDKGRMHGFQLWANLPANQKMMPPRYRDIKASDIPTVNLDHGVEVKIIAGELDGQTGPMEEIIIDPVYMDISIPGLVEYVHRTDSGHNAFIYAIAGQGVCDGQSIANRTLALFGDGDEIAIRAGEDGIRFLLCSGKPLNEPVAWGGPIVMNTQEELDLAFQEYRDGTFIKD